MTGWTIAITGHRPQGIDGDFTCKGEVWSWIRDEIYSAYNKIKPAKVITGMALGVDTIAAEVALGLQIPYIAAVPFKGQEAKWSPTAQQYYHTLLSYAESVEITDPGPYSDYVMQKRNQWMVDRADLVLAVWNGRKGGTRNCIEYALKQKVPVFRLDPVTRKIGRYDGTKHIVRDELLNA